MATSRAPSDSCTITSTPRSSSSTPPWRPSWTPTASSSTGSPWRSRTPPRCSLRAYAESVENGFPDGALRRPAGSAAQDARDVRGGERSSAVEPGLSSFCFEALGARSVDGQRPTFVRAPSPASATRLFGLYRRAARRVRLRRSRPQSRAYAPGSRRRPP